jgi:hypothetical protein
MGTNIFPISTGGGLVMQGITALAVADVNMKDTAGSITSADLAGFWTAIDVTHTPLGWESVKLAAAADTTEQTIVDTTGEGVLTHVLAPELGSNGTMTIRVTRDGEVLTFISETIGNSARFMIGDFRGYLANSGSGGVGVGAVTDDGYAIASQSALMTTPIQAITSSNNGIKFTNTLKVTIQGSVNITAVADRLNAAACYTLALPEGL